MRAKLTIRNGMGLTLCAWAALGTAGCGSEPPPTDKPAPLPALSPSTAADVPPPTDLTPEALPPIDSLRQDVKSAEHAFDSNIKPAARGAETARDATQALPDLTPPLEEPKAPVPVIGTAREGVSTAVSEVDQGVQQISGELQGVVRQTADEVRQGIRNKADDLKKDIRQTAEGLDQKAQSHTQRMTDDFVKQLEQKGKDKLKQTFDRAREEILKEIAPKKP